MVSIGSKTSVRQARNFGVGLAAAATIALTLGVGSALGAEPNNQACLGTDFSSYAREGAPGPVLTFDPGAGFGQFNASLAQRVPGLGFPIQLHLAGYLPDAYVVNSCND